MKRTLTVVFVFLLLVSFVLSAKPVSASQATGTVYVISSTPDLVCVGDSFTMTGWASVEYPETPPDNSDDIPLAPLYVTTVQITAQHGKVSPSLFTEGNDGYYFKFTYTAASEGEEDIQLVLNNGIWLHHVAFKVQKNCDFDAFLLTYMNFSTDAGGEEFRSFTTVRGMGTMKRLRTGELYLQGDGKWDLEENVLSKPAMCVQWYIPPLITSGPFDLDGKMSEEGDEVEVILAFQPSGKPTYHGKSICVDENGDVGEGWSVASGGNSDLASKIQATFPSSGGSQSVEMTGAGLNMVQSMGDLEYTAQLTLIPR